MPFPLSDNQTRLKNISTCLLAASRTLHMLSTCLKDPVLVAIANTTESLLQCAQAIKQNKNNCSQLLEQTHELLDTIIVLYIKSDSGGNFTPSVLKHLGKFTETLHRVNTFVDAQQNSKVRSFFRQGEMSALLKDCKAGLQQGLDFFQGSDRICQQVKRVELLTDITKMQLDAERRHQEALGMIDNLPDETSSESSGIYSGSYTSSSSISILPSEPKIFHGREAEVEKILQQFRQGTPRTAILGAGGMGKTALARAILHHPDIIARFGGHRMFVACDTAKSKIELAALIGGHLGLKPSKDMTQAILQCLIQQPSSLLILDNLETVWEPTQSRKEIEAFLALLSDVNHLALLITMRGAERPTKVQWTRPFLQPLQPLAQNAARQTFFDIADDWHSPAEVDKVLSLTDNMPLAISLLASLADVEGCPRVLSQWEEEKTAMISDGYDRKSNLDLSISLSLSSLLEYKPTRWIRGGELRLYCGCDASMDMHCPLSHWHGDAQPVSRRRTA
ncbi:P-loop containing nucleoside triphosphate hydrolase protein [Mycena polygramma]|nr:P-loop containing nucleoside triphosphate hydrolase protein [Mycena polygramma]